MLIEPLILQWLAFTSGRQEYVSTHYMLVVLGLTTRQPLWVILCNLPEWGRKEIEEIVEEVKEMDMEERGTGMKVKKQMK